MLNNHGLVGVGRRPANLRNAHGETFGSISGLWSDPAAWSRQGDSFSGAFFAMPDRGYNIAGTINYIPPASTASISCSRPPPPAYRVCPRTSCVCPCRSSSSRHSPARSGKLSCPPFFVFQGSMVSIET